MPDELKNELCGVEVNVLEELKKFEEMVIAGQSFFQVVKEKAKSNPSTFRSKGREMIDLHYS